MRPASTYAYRVQRHGGKVAVFNLEPSEKDKAADFVFSGPRTMTPSIGPLVVKNASESEVLELVTLEVRL